MKKKSKFQNPEFYSAIFQRFVRAFISGAVASATPLVIANIQNFSDLKMGMIVLVLSMTVGGVNGVLMALDKAVRFK